MKVRAKRVAMVVTVAAASGYIGWTWGWQGFVSEMAGLVCGWAAGWALGSDYGYMQGKRVQYGQWVETGAPS